MNRYLGVSIPPELPLLDNGHEFGYVGHQGGAFDPDAQDDDVEEDERSVGCVPIGNEGYAHSDAQVSRFTFHERLVHYLDGEEITKHTRGAVEIAVMVEAGTFVCDGKTDRKEKLEQNFYDKYLDLIEEIEDDNFVPGVRDLMIKAYYKAKSENTPKSLFRKYKEVMTQLKTFASRFPGINCLADLPSGSTQISDMKKPLIMKLWKGVNPVSPVRRIRLPHLSTNY